MQNKIGDFYTPVKSNQLLKDRFNHSPIMMELIGTMSVTTKKVFAALCDGHRVTTAGYLVPADMTVVRASAIIHALREMNLPIATAHLVALSDAGNETRQAVFYMERSLILRLSSEPNNVIEECRELRREKKLIKARKDIKRIYRDFGKETIITMTDEAEQLYKDKD